MRRTRRLIAAFRPVLDTLFPPTCWAEPGAVHSIAGLSESARLDIARLANQRYCRACGLTTGPFASNDSQFRCGRCEERDPGVVRMARVGTFDEPLVTLVHRLKFGRAWEVAGVLCPFLYQAMLRVAEESHVPVDALVPIPLHWTRFARRGFNQAEELARETAKLAQWRVLTPLRRIRRTAQQSGIHAPARRAENLRGAFICKFEARLAGKHLWLIDDVSTTGATLHAAATAIRKLPKEFRPASINAAVICITHRDSPPTVPEILGNFATTSGPR